MSFTETGESSRRIERVIDIDMDMDKEKMLKVS